MLYDQIFLRKRFVLLYFILNTRIVTSEKHLGGKRMWEGCGRKDRKFRGVFRERGGFRHSPNVNYRTILFRIFLFLVDTTKITGKIILLYMYNVQNIEEQKKRVFNLYNA